MVEENEVMLSSSPLQNDSGIQSDDLIQQDSPIEEEPVIQEGQDFRFEPIFREEISGVEETSSTDSSGPRSKRVSRKRSPSSRVYAGFFVRFTAYLLDKVIVGVPLVIVRLILWMLQDADTSNILLRKIFFSFTLTDIILYLVSIAYFVLMTYFMGRTFGKRIMKLKVVSAEDRKPTFFEIAFREIIGRYLSTFILWIGYLMIGAGDQKEALHDYLADTRVVYALD